MAAAKAAENRWDKWGLTWYLWWANLNLLTKSTRSSRSTEFKDILPWNISQMITKIIPLSTRIVISYAMKWGIPFWVRLKLNGNWDNNMIRISQWRESHCRTTTSLRREGLWKSQSGIWVGKLTTWVRSFEIWDNTVHQIYQFH